MDASPQYGFGVEASRRSARLRVVEAPPSHFMFLGGRLGLQMCLDFRALEAVDAYGKIHAMVGFEKWTENSAHLHVVLDSAAGARRILVPAFEFLFVRCGRRIALGTVNSDNPKALKLDTHLGFKETHRTRDGIRDGVDAIHLELRREDCRFIKAGA